ncbi:MAG: thioredoxin family protein [Alphaproteobacteria bacterium]|nr:thioredoxin family protein [Alphaproteobacteria bacterium]
MNIKRVVRNTILIAVGAIAIASIFFGGSEKPKPYEPTPEIKEYAAATIVPFKANELANLIAANQGAPTLLFAYASWCPHCKKQFLMLSALNIRFNDALKIEYIALNHDQYKLAAFLKEKYVGEIPFTPYHLAIENREAFNAVLEGYGFTPENTVPHIFLFDAQGKPVTEFKGLTEIPVLLPEIQKLVKSKTPEEASQPLAH